MTSPDDFPTDHHEYLFGAYDIGRWMWDLAPTGRFAPPIPATGHQGLWRWSPSH